VRLGNPVVPRFLATAVGVRSAAVRNADDSDRSSAFDDQSDLYADLSGPGSIIAGAIEPPALTRKSCAPNAAAWVNDACVLTSTFVKAAAGQHTWSPLAIDNLLRHSLNTDTIGATVGRTAWTADAISAIQPHLAPATIQSARRDHRERKKPVLMKPPRRRREGNDLCPT